MNKNTKTPLSTNRFTVILETVGGPTDGYQYYFLCWADDEDHAREQAINAYPADIAIEIYSGEPK